MTNILFVCKHNRFRSVIAEAFFKKLNKDKKIKAKSAGVIVGNPVGKGVRRVAKSLNLQIKTRPDHLSQKLLQWQNIIVIVADNVPHSLFANKKIKRVRVDLIICSKLKRAQATLNEIISNLSRKIPIIYTSAINEMDIGEFQRNGKDDWEAWHFAAAASGLPFGEFRPNGGESFEDVYERAKRFYEQLLKKHSFKHILLVGHATFSMYIILNALGLPSNEGKYYQLSNASVSTLDINKSRKVLKFHINDYHHLIWAGLKVNHA